MGNQFQKQNFKNDNMKKFSDVAKFIKDYDDPCYGDIKVYKSKENKETKESKESKESKDNVRKLIMMKQKIIPEQTEFDKLIKLCESRMEFSHPNWLEFYGYHFN